MKLEDLVIRGEEDGVLLVCHRREDAWRVTGQKMTAAQFAVSLAETLGDFKRASKAVAQALSKLDPEAEPGEPWAKLSANGAVLTLGAEFKLKCSAYQVKELAEQVDSDLSGDLHLRVVDKRI